MSVSNTQGIIPDAEPEPVSYGADNRINHLEYLIYEVYRPRLEESVNFRNVMQFMPFMREIMPQVYILGKSGDSKKISALFFDHLKHIEEEGKYQSFVEALRQSQYPFLVEALENKEVIIHNEMEHKQLIHIFFKDIVETIDPEHVSLLLLEKQVISVEESEQIRRTARQSSTSDASFELLLKIPHRVSNWYELFLTVLLEENHNNLVKKIDTVFFEKKKGNSEDEPTSLTEDSREEPIRRDAADYDETLVQTAVPLRPKTNTSPFENSEVAKIEINNIRKEFTELKSVLQQQAQYLQKCLKDMELSIGRVEKLEHKLEHFLRTTNSAHNVIIR